MKKSLFAIGLLLCVSMFGQIGQQISFLDLTRDRASVTMHRMEVENQSYSYGPVEGVDQALKINWTQTRFGRFEVFFSRQVRMPFFSKATFKVDVFIPENSSLLTFNLRLIDRENEIFQFRVEKQGLKAGWQTLDFHVDTAYEKYLTWGGKNNKKLDAPIRLYGIAADFVRSEKDELVNWMAVKGASIVVTEDCTPGSIGLETGNPIHVLRPGEEGQLALMVKNDTFRQMKGTVEFKVEDCFGNQIEEGKRAVNLGIGDHHGFKLTAPKLFGTYYVHCVLNDQDPKVEQVKKTVRFAYMVPAGPTPGRGKGFLFGVCSHPQRYSRADQEKEAMAAAWCGVKIMREDINWQRMQPKEDVWAFDSFDFTQAIFEKYGIEIEAIYSYCADWAKAKDWKPLDPTKRGNPRPDYGHWGRFCAKFAERYRGKVHYVEVWNEPDLFGFANFSAEEYIEMMKIAYRETKRMAPEMTVLTGGFTTTKPFARFNDPDHMDKCLTLGRGSYDVHAFHGHGRYLGYRDRIGTLLQLRKDLKVTAPWYANETANPSTDGGEYFQAIQLFQKFLFSWARGSIGYNWYDLRNDGFDLTYGEHNFGLITFDFYPKCAYPTYNMLATLFTQAEYLQDLDLGEGDQDAFVFRARNGDLLIPNWNNERSINSRMVLLTGITGEASMVDMFGNEQPLPVENGAVVLKVDRQPATLCLKNQKELPVAAGDVFVTRKHSEILKGGSNVSKSFQLRQQDFMIIPGQESTLAFQMSNPTPSAMEATIAVKLPEGLSLVSGKQGKVSIPAKSDYAATFGLAASPSFRSGTIVVDASLGKLWKDQVSIPADSVALIGDALPQHPQFVLNRRDQNTKLVVEAGDLQHLTWAGPADLSAEIRLAAKDEKLILDVIVKDDKHVQPFKGFDVWQGDNIQFALNLGTEPYYEFGLTRLADGKPEAFVFLAPKDVKPVINLETSRDEASKTTHYVATIPFDQIGMTAQILRDGFLFNILVNDNDGDIREGYLALAPGIGSHKSTRNAAVVKQK
jgi:hypothetical protein